MFFIPAHSPQKFGQTSPFEACLALLAPSSLIEYFICNVILLKLHLKNQYWVKAKQYSISLLTNRILYLQCHTFKTSSEKPIPSEDQTIFNIRPILIEYFICNVILLKPHLKNQYWVKANQYSSLLIEYLICNVIPLNPHLKYQC